ncbi:metal-dependent transcriptional regulator [Methanohalophilus profundi]|uniref:metal-dependent transcriptional regulator n=1 Tax=Methanohalophilus profundi TaxID=2138083 RepID=UPI00101E169E|nr:metal-dependent transcriptional regulator [Methanohalophilus profundi]
MEKITGLELSPRKIEYLKYIHQRKENVRTNELSAHLKVDPSTTTKTINELAEEGYVNHVPYRGVKLTEKGKEYAAFLIRRHRILSLMLKNYGLSPEEACREVSRFESFVSLQAIDTICSTMGHPTMGVCGKIEHPHCDV